MTTVTPNSPLLVALRPDLEFSSNGNKQTDADNQRQAWLRQMELSQMSLLQADGNIKQAALGNGANGSAAPSANQSFAGDADARSPDLLPVHPIIEAQRQQAAAESASGTASAESEPVAASAGTVAPSTSKLANSSADDADPNAASASGAMNAAPQANAAAGMATGRTGTTSAAQPTIGAATAPAAALTLSGEAGPTQSAAPAQLTLGEAAPPSESWSNPATDPSSPALATASGNVANGAAPVVRSPAVAAESTQTPAAEGEDDIAEPTASRSAKQEDGAGQTWQKRAMHVAQDGSDLSVSIRDAALDERQSAQVVARIAADAGQAGMRVRSATVNGKTVLKLSKDDRMSASSTGNAVPTYADSLLSSYDTQEQ